MIPRVGSLAENDLIMNTARDDRVAANVSQKLHDQ